MNAAEQYRAWTDGIERRNWLGVEDVERCVCLADAAIKELEAELEDERKRTALMKQHCDMAIEERDAARAECEQCAYRKLEELRIAQRQHCDMALGELEAEVERLNWMLRTLVREGHERKNRRAGYRDFYELVLQDLEDAYYAEKEREP